MILCVSPSPAWDVTYHVERLAEHATNRALSAAGRAGGKAVNVARVLHALDVPVRVLAPVAGPTGRLFTADLEAAGVLVEAMPVAGDMRRTVTIVSEETGDATVVAEQGRLPDWPRYLDTFERLLPTSAVVVASGSLPADLPVDAFAVLTRLAERHGVPVLVDTSGPALQAAVSAAPALVKPNLDELRALRSGSPEAAARSLAAGSPTAVAVSQGAGGLLLVHGEDTWTARLRTPLRGNPTGAGDAVVAAFARGLLAGTPWRGLLADAVALAGAVVLSRSAGEFSAADHERLHRDVLVENVGAPGVGAAR